MLSPVVPSAELATGQRMNVEEFLCRWDKLPELKNAELIDGMVYVPSPLSSKHARRDYQIHWWLSRYEEATPGCQGASNGTWFMLDSAPQPDVFLRILPAHGGRSGNKLRNKEEYFAGAPELVVEICESSADLDLGPKLRLYQRAGVREYITVEIPEQRIVWRTLDEHSIYHPQVVPADGILRSQVFPGLWLDVAAFWADDGPKMLVALSAGLASEDHLRFMARLAATK
jgi:Uma2 family endonuclease